MASVIEIHLQVTELWEKSFYFWIAPRTFINSISCLHEPSFRSQVAILSEKSTVFNFSYKKAYVTKFDLGINNVKVNPGSSFVQTMMDWSLQDYIQSFVEIGPLVPEEKIFKGFYHKWAWRPAWLCDLDHLYKLLLPLPKEAIHEI